MLLSPANIHFTKALRRDYEVHGRTPLPESRRPVRPKPGTSYPRLTVQTLPQTSLSTGDDQRVRIRWEGISNPYANMPTQGILGGIKNVIRGSGNPMVAKVQLAAVDKLKSGDLDLYVYEVRDQERLTHNARSWLPELQKGEQAKLLHKQYAILVHSAPLDFLPRERDVTETKGEILRENSRVIPDAVISYVGWATQSSKGNKRESSLLVAFDQPSHANKMLRGRFFLRGVALGTELYDPGLRIVQCRKCLFFGHVENCCTTLVRCPFCALAHRKEQCKILGMPHLSRCSPYH